MKLLFSIALFAVIFSTTLYHTLPQEWPEIPAELHELPTIPTAPIIIIPLQPLEIPAVNTVSPFLFTIYRIPCCRILPDVEV